MDQDGNQDSTRRAIIILGDIAIDNYDIVSGAAGCGKTQRALAEFNRGLLVSTLDDLRHVTSTTTHLVFDDFDFSSSSPEQAIHLLDSSMPQTIKARY